MPDQLTSFRRRIERERDTARRDGGSTDRPFYEGVNSIHRLFLAALREARAEPSESVGKPFDPTIHEAVATTPAAGAESGIVVRQERRGQ
jgi:molecular chaperone GrpE